MLICKNCITLHYFARLAFRSGNLKEKLFLFYSYFSNKLLSAEYMYYALGKKAWNNL
jgi:hypothetical protein